MDEFQKKYLELLAEANKGFNAIAEAIREHTAQLKEQSNRAQSILERQMAQAERLLTTPVDC